MAASILKRSSARLCKTLAVSISIIVVFVVFLFSNQPNCLRTDIFHVTPRQSLDPTNISHLVFGILGSVNTWSYRNYFIESWWRPNVTRGYVYFDSAPTHDLLPWSPNWPPWRISDNATKIKEESNHISELMVRMVHAVMEVFRDEREGVRWYIMGDDDSIFFVDNLVDVLSELDHTQYIYIGCHSETLKSNQMYSFDMGFGGAGLILSYPLVKLVQKNIDYCFKRYPTVRSADLILMTCVNDFGVSMTDHQGLHQMDLRGDASGFFSTHPKAPLLSLHHFEHIEPIFPSKNRSESLEHLMKSANVDQSRLLQQTICYNRQFNWTFAVSWGYSVHLYEDLVPRSFLKSPIETFRPWVWDAKPPYYIFDTRPLKNDSCETPHVFSFDSLTKVHGDNEVITNYVRKGSRGLPTCESAGNRSGDLVSRIQVVSPTTKPRKNGKTECCDVVETSDMEVAKLKLRGCFEDELIS